MAASDLLLAAAAVPLAVLLVAAARTDLAERRIPNAVNLALLLVGLAVSVAGIGIVPWPLALAGAGVGLALTGAARLLLGPAKIGFGDVKMTTALGAWLGPFGLAVATLVACIGLLVVAALRRRREAAPFAPYLAAGTAVAYGLGLWAGFGGAA